MSALLLKDYYVIFRQMKIFLLLILVFSCIPGTFYSTFAVVYASMLPYTALAYDERSKWDQLAAMMPYSARDVVLSKYNVVVPQEENEQYEALTYNWNKLREIEKQQQDVLQKVSPQFKNQVVEGMDQFLIDFQLFLKQYHEEGPMAPGLTPSEASEKLKIFQHQFDNFQKRWTTYSGGQELFGLPRTELPELADLAKQLRQLAKDEGITLGYAASRKDTAVGEIVSQRRGRALRGEVVTTGEGVDEYRRFAFSPNGIYARGGAK